MPIYEYECTECKHNEEVIQKMDDDPLTECSKCKTETMERMVTSAAFRLRGNGWYETDFKTGKRKNLVSKM
jgi:putative FmdB family regulatory protein